MHAWEAAAQLAWSKISCSLSLSLPASVAAPSVRKALLDLLSWELIVVALLMPAPGGDARGGGRVLRSGRLGSGLPGTATIT